MERFKPFNKETVLDTLEVEYYPQFAYANLNEQSRIEAITNVASICYQSSKSLGSESLYNRLMAESAGLPSSSFEMCPVLLDQKEITSLYYNRSLLISDNNPLTKFGEWIEDRKYLLTNFRAIVFLFENYNIDLRKRFNTKEECEIIEKHFKVFLFNVDLPTRAQMVRHRVNWQEISRRYVSGSRVPFTFYIPEKIKSLQPLLQEVEAFDHQLEHNRNVQIELTYDTHIANSLALYNHALDNGIKPEEARRFIPQFMETKIWGGFQPTQLENFFKLRSDSHAQKEIRNISDAMQRLIKAKY